MNEFYIGMPHILNSCEMSHILNSCEMSHILNICETSHMSHDIQFIHKSEVQGDIVVHIIGHFIHKSELQGDMVVHIIGHFIHKSVLQGDMVVYTTGHVIEKDKSGPLRGVHECVISVCLRVFFSVLMFVIRKEVAFSQREHNCPRRVCVRCLNVYYVIKKGKKWPLAT